jgi:hypothetical protein
MVLHEPGEVGWEGRIEFPAVNPVGQVLYNPQAPVLSVAPGTIGMVHLITIENPGPVEEVVNQAVDGNHVLPDPPVVPPGISCQEQTRQRHVGELRADIRNRADFPDEGLEEVVNG